LWTIGGTLEFSIAGLHLAIPGFLVVAAAIYAIIASGSIALIGRRFVPGSEAKNQAEAEYRYMLTRLRENGESMRSYGARRKSAPASSARSGRSLLPGAASAFST
jgi:vitamin B12/bleomycin/antimicrobial peptide transport system ATP-binding/permease protein